MNNTQKQNLNCAQRVVEEYESRLLDFKNARAFFNDQKNPYIIEKARELGCEDYDDFFQWVNEYGLAWDFVEPKTEYNSGAGYYRWQISWGGGSDEFRIYISEEYLPHRNEIKKIEYWFLDWYDGASIETSHELIQQIIDCFLECSEIKTEREIEGGIE